MTGEVDPELFETFAALVRGNKSPEDAERLLLRYEDAEAVAAVRERWNEHVARVRSLDKPRTLSREGLETWYDGPQPSDVRWHRLLAQLELEGWSDSERASLDAASTKIVSYLPYPHSGSYESRGLVLGYVQSGKTSNFTAVVAKAADRGVRLFIILSGIHNGLRHQTQVRLDKHLYALAPDSWFPLTGSEQDFDGASSPDAHLRPDQPSVAFIVVKKNGARLKRVRDWLERASPAVRQSCPVMVIDDEADQASVNTAKLGNRPTAINRLVREILGKCPRSMYVGYTATPFANLFIDPTGDDLYPRDFIVDLPRPAAHFGPERIFGREPLDEDDERAEGLDMVRHVHDDEIDDLRPSSPRERFDFEPSLTASLEQAVRYFWLATAARRVRGHSSEHSTMLVHTSQHPIVHEKFRYPLGQFRAAVLDGLGRDDPTLVSGLEQQWNSETAAVDAGLLGEQPVSFAELRPHLTEVVESSKVVTDNSSSPDRLDYGDDPQVVIAVGGNTLSRGLTLEGLVVSFFIRSAAAYDTLLQMGRWFGYRPGYTDLPRIWLTTELATWFRDLALVEFDMRRDVERYEREHLNPREFAVRIRTHPKLTITAASKMRAAVVAHASYEGRRLQTIHFHRSDAEWLRANQAAAVDLVTEARRLGCFVHRNEHGPVILRDVPSGAIIDFLAAYRVHERAREMNSDYIVDYIGRQRELPGQHLDRWNVGLMATRAASLGTIDLGLDFELPLIRRARLKLPDDQTADIKALMSKVDRVADLAIEPSAAREYNERQLVEARRPPPGTGGIGFLALYPVQAMSRPRVDESRTRVPLDAVHDVIGLGLVFPPSDDPTAVEYRSADLSKIVLDELEPGEESAEEDEAAA